MIIEGVVMNNTLEVKVDLFLRQMKLEDPRSIDCGAKPPITFSTATQMSQVELDTPT